MSEPLDIGDADQVAERNTRLKVKEQSDDDQFKALMQQKEFRVFAWRMLEEAQMFHTTMTGNSFTFFNEGKRAMGLWLMEKINRLTPELYMAMCREGQAKAKKGND